VIRHQVDALKKDGSLLVLSGDPVQQPFPAPVRYIRGIGYDDEEKNTPSPQKIAGEIHNAILAQWKEGCDLLHIHNPTLAKNRAFLKTLKALQTRGINLFLQIHDFAEDGRPQVQFEEDYPENCHYGVINKRDYEILLDAGLKPEGLHRIPSPVRSLGRSGRSSSKTDDVLYPIRAIRRKNIGEALLLSLFFSPKETLSITLPPNSPVDLAAYEGWKHFARENRLDVHFDSGLENDFKALVHRSHYLITTSITEGFGYTFLEAWTAGKLIRGRDLAGITHDFKQEGLNLDHLYQSLRVPLSWIDHSLFFNKWEACILENSTRFGLNLNIETIKKKITQFQDENLIDFGLLDESFQKSVIRKLVADPAQKTRLIKINPFLADPVSPDTLGPIIDANRRVISEAFSTKAYRLNLLKIYKTVVRGNVRQRIDKKHLAASFFDLDSFSLLKWGPYVESE